MIWEKEEEELFFGRRKEKKFGEKKDFNEGDSPVCHNWKNIRDR